MKNINQLYTNYSPQNLPSDVWLLEPSCQMAGDFIFKQSTELEILLYEFLAKIINDFFSAFQESAINEHSYLLFEFKVLFLLLLCPNGL